MHKVKLNNATEEQIALNVKKHLKDWGLEDTIDYNSPYYEEYFEGEVEIDKSNGQIIIKVPGGVVVPQNCKFAERVLSSSIEFFYTDIDWDAKIDVEDEEDDF